MNSNLRNLRGNKKPVEAELNLTSFIDLLSTCVCFLLVTAVWIQIGSMEIKQSHGTEGAESKKKTIDMEVVFKNKETLLVHLKEGSKVIQKLEVKNSPEVDLIDGFKVNLKDQIVAFLDSKSLEVTSTTITPHKEVDYGNMIKVMSVLRSNEFLNIGILSEKFK
jgi:biopolymer transport protein ExbD